MARDGYDVVVVGAGPAGALAAKHAAEGGVNVLLLERKQHVGLPVRCGEGVGVRSLLENVQVEPGWVGEHIVAVRMVSPDRTVVDITRLDEGYIVRRDIMDPRLVEHAQASGAAYRSGVTVVAVERRSSGLYVCTSADGQQFVSRCLILADGVEARLARYVGWEGALSMDDVCSCAFARVRHPDVPRGKLEMHYGTSVTPGGYAWVFPRGDGAANVGLGVLGSRSSGGKAGECLTAFIDRRFPGGETTELHCGGVPLGAWRRPLVRDGAMIVGDAARQVDALTGGGITYAMAAGRLAGTAAAAAFSGDVFRPRRLLAYQRAWAKGPGKQQMRSYALKCMVTGLSDDELNRIARELKRGESRASLARICLAAFRSRPILLLKALLLYR
jgi:digeranylgeranylglycerophospholipid reductase